jgi:hypothetical protein
MKRFTLRYSIIKLTLPGLFLLLSACASQTVDVARPEAPISAAAGTLATSTAHFPEWSVITISLGDSGHQGSAPAVVVKLVGQADVEIAKSNWQAASSTLERLLRIAPDYAPGWSRMAWLSLQTGDSDRARQMAERSNSYATGRIDLKLLNWKFVREASVQLKDGAAIQRANRNIHALENL